MQQVEVMQCSDLPAMDLNGYADPYVKVRWGKAVRSGGSKGQYIPENELGRTSYKTKTLFPKWTAPENPEEFEGHSTPLQILLPFASC